MQAVLERPVAEVAAPVVRELRLALLAPAELSALEEQNRLEPLIPVRTEVRVEGRAKRRSREHLEKDEGTVGLSCGPSPTGGADRGGVEMPCLAERGYGPGCAVPP